MQGNKESFKDIESRKIMSDVIRGGQVTLHKYRMLYQVLRALFTLSILIFISVFCLNFYKNTSRTDWKFFFINIKKELADKAATPKYIHKFSDIFYYSIDQILILHLLLVGGVIIYFGVRGRLLKENKNLRGIFLLKAKKLKQELRKNNKITKKYSPFTIADFPFPIAGRKHSFTAGEQTHTLLLGSTGAGKTKIIQDLVEQLRIRRQKTIIVDVKGDYIAHFHDEKRGDIILNPLDIRGQNWSIFKETTPLKGFSTIAKSLLPKESKGDPIWVDAARGVFAELANLYVSENLSMADFASIILKSDIGTLAKLLDKTSASKIINLDIEKAALSVLMVLSTYLRPLKLYQNNKNCFSITDWVNDMNNKNFLFISSRSDVKEDVNPIITAQVDIAINAIRSLVDESNIPKLWFILDEIPYFESGIPSLKDGLAMARSYGGAFVLGSQDMSSLSKIYSENTARSIANNCKTKIFMNIAGKETSEYCSSALGEGEIEEWHEGISYGAHEMRDGIQVNRQRVMRKVVLPSEFMMLKTGEGYINFSGFKPAKFRFKDCSFKKIAPSYIENTHLLEMFRHELEIGEQRRREIEAKLLSRSNKQENNQQNEKNKKNEQNEKKPEVVMDI